MNIRDRQEIKSNTDIYLGTIQVESKDLLMLLDDLEEAVRIIRQGKQQFAPHTTNSDVDFFLKKYDETCYKTIESN